MNQTKNNMTERVLGMLGNEFTKKMNNQPSKVNDENRTKINVQDWYYSEQQITIRFYDENGDIVECDHAGAEEEILDFYYGPDGSEEKCMVCDKCEAYMVDYTDDWILPEDWYEQTFEQ